MEDREIMEDFFHSSCGTHKVTLPSLSSNRAPIFQQSWPRDSLRQNPGENTDTTENNIIWNMSVTNQLNFLFHLIGPYVMPF